MLACACEAETAAYLCSGGFALLGTVYSGIVVEAAEGREGRPRRLAEDLDMGVDGMSIGEFVWRGPRRAIPEDRWSCCFACRSGEVRKRWNGE
jgi:hypothetical protein